jgi:hypothetical protein
VPEILGSSSRYGHRYGEKQLWNVEDEVQFYLDWIAWRAGILNPSEESRLGKSFQRAEPLLSRAAAS